MEADAAVALPQHPAQLTKKNSSTLSQVGGHPGSFKVGSRRNSLSKTSVPAEAAAYESLQQSDIARFAPQYHGFKLCEAKAGAKGKKKDKEEAEQEEEEEEEEGEEEEEEVEEEVTLADVAQPVLGPSGDFDKEVW